MAKSFDKCADELKGILADAEAAVAGGVRGPMLTARDALIAFVENSDNRVDGVTELDEVASTARRDVSLGLLGQGLVADIGSRTGEVASLVKRFSTQSATNTSAAATLRFERTRALSDAALVMMDELKKFGELADASTVDGRKLTKALQAAIEAIATVKQQVGA